jgi:hypothetical protein
VSRPERMKRSSRISGSRISDTLMDILDASLYDTTHNGGGGGGGGKKKKKKKKKLFPFFF